MDGKRFDELTRVMGAGASRRRVLKGFAAGIGGGLAALAGKRMGALAAATGEACTIDTDCDAGLSCINDRCQECGPYTNMTVFCPAGQYCDVGGSNGVCADCNCATNEVCADANYTPDNQPVANVCSCPNTTCTDGCCAPGQACDVSGVCSDTGGLHQPCTDNTTCDTGLYCIFDGATYNCDVCSITPDNPCAGGLFCDVSGYWAACVDLCDGVTCADTETCDPGTGDCNCNADLCGGVCCNTGTHCVDDACKGPSDLGGICSDTDPCAAGLFCIPNGVNPDNATDPSAGYCEECNPDIVPEAVCAEGSFCNVSGSFGVCDSCDCADNETCAPVGGSCGCDTICCGATDDVEGVCCAEGLVCSAGGSCVQCAADTDCADGQICADGVCIVPCATDLCGGVCCNAGDMCMDNACMAPECATDSDCTGGKVCKAQMCVVQCTTDGDCGADEVCDVAAGVCKAKPECVKNTDCPGDEVCNSGVCKAAEQAGNGTSGNGSDTGNGTVTTLPTTGIGGSKSGGSSSWLGAAAIGGAAALLAGKKLRDLTGTTDAE
jgi:Cys-rich repeat protein